MGKTNPMSTDSVQEGDASQGTHPKAMGNEKKIVLTEDVLMKLEKARCNAFSIPVDGRLSAELGNQDIKVEKKSSSGSSASTSSYPDPDGYDIPVRTSQKRGSIGSLASLDTADQFSDLSFDAGSPGQSPTIGGLHLSNHDVSSSAPA